MSHAANLNFADCLRLTLTPYAPGTGVALGLAIGTALGAAFNDIGIGVAVGVALGAAFDSLSYVKKKDKAT